MAKIILLTELLDLRQQKQQELEFYNNKLKELNNKLYFIDREIKMTNFIIELIEKEKILDLREFIKNDSAEPKSD